jgi:hypothetical protein
MTYGRLGTQEAGMNIDGATISHSAELVRGKFALLLAEGPLTPALSPRGEGDRGACVWTATEGKA